MTKLKNRKRFSGCQEQRKRKAWEESGVGYKRAIWAILVKMELFYILTLSMSISWLWYYTIVLQMLSLGKLGKKYMTSHCIISYNCMWIYNDLINISIKIHFLVLKMSFLIAWCFLFNDKFEIRLIIHL